MTNLAVSLVLTARDETAGAFKAMQDRVRDIGTRFAGVAGSGGAVSKAVAGVGSAFSTAANAARSAGSIIVGSFRAVGGAITATFNALTSFKALLLSLGAAAIVRSFIGVADTLEKVRISLDAMTGSSRAGGDILARMQILARESAIDFEKLAGAAASLSTTARSTAEVEKFVRIAADIAALRPDIPFEDIVSNLNRALAGGIAAAEIFRERGISSFLGFQAGVSYSADETKRKILEVWEDTSKGLNGATKRMNTTWSGAMSQLKDLWFDFRKVIIVDSGIADQLKTMLFDATQYLRDFMNSHNMAKEAARAWELIRHNVSVVVIAIKEAYDKAVEFFEAISDPGAALEKVKRKFEEIGEGVKEAFSTGIDTPAVDSFFDTVRNGIRGAVGAGIEEGVEDVHGVDIPIEYELPDPPSASARSYFEEQRALYSPMSGAFSSSNRGTWSDIVEPVETALEEVKKVHSAREEEELRHAARMAEINAMPDIAGQEGLTGISRPADIEFRAESFSEAWLKAEEASNSAYAALLKERDSLRRAYESGSLDGIKAWSSEQLGIMDALHANGLMSEEEYQFAREALQKETDERIRRSIEETGTFSQRIMLEVQKRAVSLANTVGNSFAGMASDIASGTKSASESVREFGKSIVKAFTEMIAKMLTFAAIGAAIGFVVGGPAGAMTGAQIGARAGMGGGFESGDFGKMDKAGVGLDLPKIGASTPSLSVASAASGIMPAEGLSPYREPQQTTITINAVDAPSFKSLLAREGGDVVRGIVSRSSKQPSFRGAMG